MGIDYSEVFSKLKGSQGSFIYSLMSKWYVIIAIPAMVVTYNVFKALSDAGILDKMQKNLEAILAEITKVSVDCPKYLGDFNDFLQCLGF